MNRLQLERWGMKNLSERALIVSIAVKDFSPSEVASLYQDLKSRISSAGFTSRIVPGGLAMLISENPHSSEQLEALHQWLLDNNVECHFLDK